MAAPVLLAADFAKALQSLMPRGRVWPRDADAMQTKVCAGLAPTYERQSARAADLLVEAFPATTVELLEEWELSLGLPDPCAGEAPTIAERQAQVLTKFIGLASANKDYIIALMALLGYTITITQFTFHKVTSPVDYPLYGVEWANAWQVNAPLDTISYFTVMSGVDEPLSTWGNEVLECVIEALAPAHTVVVFAYS